MAVIPRRLAKFPHAVKQVAASSLVTIILDITSGLWLRGRFIDEMWEEIPALEDENFQPISIVQIAIRDRLGIDFPEWDVLAVTTDGRLFEYTTNRDGYTREWKAIP